MSLALAGAASAQLTGYTNSGEFISTSPLVIDATNFVNLGEFGITISGFDTVPFDFSDVLTYTNRNFMYCDLGFVFNDSPATSGQIKLLGRFCQSKSRRDLWWRGRDPMSDLASFTSTTSAGTPQILIGASNIVNSGLLQVGQTGQISALGSSLDFSQGSVLVEGFDQISTGLITNGPALVPGAFIQYWGIGQQSNVLTRGDLSLSGPYGAAA